MSSRAKKSGTVTPSPAMSSQQSSNTTGKTTPINLPGTSASQSSSASQQRPGSPYSPTRVTRIQEKNELQNLNDRLACYIDRVRNLETENSRLVLEIQSCHETTTREISNIKSMYVQELSDARKLLDITAKEKARLEIDTTRLWEENDELKKLLEKKKKECLIAENNARMYESRFTDINGKYLTACSERDKALDCVKELELENDKLRKLLSEARKNLEEETLARVDLENNIQSLQEELTFKEQVHEQELTKTRTTRQVEVSEIDGRLSKAYEDKLQQSLQELREQYEGQMRANRDEVEQMYDNKIRSLENQIQRQNGNINIKLEELRKTRMNIDGLNSRINELEGNCSTFQSRVRDLERLLDSERARHAEDRALLEAEIERLNAEMEHQMKQYQDLMDTKVSLDLEIAAYDKLLRGEEQRLNITASPNTSSQSTSQSVLTSQSFRRAPSRSKRRRIVLEESLDRQQADHSITSSAKSDIEIFEQDPEGKFIKLFNKSQNEIQIGGWQLQHQSGSNETTFKFHRSVKIDGNGYITVWSADTGVTHEPPLNIVMKSQKWFGGDSYKTVLLNNSGEELASAERIKHQTTSHITRHKDGRGSGGGYLSGFERVASEEIYHQQGDHTGTEKCKLM